VKPASGLRPVPAESPSMGAARGPQCKKPATFSRYGPLWMVAPRSTYGLTAGTRSSLKPSAHSCHCAALSPVATVASVAM
jgi:hypothetical protein